MRKMRKVLSSGSGFLQNKIGLLQTLKHLKLNLPENPRQLGPRQ